MDRDREWRFVWLGLEGQPVEVAGVSLWDAEWAATGRRVTVTHPRYPGERHVMSVYEVKGSVPRIQFAAGEFSYGVWGIFVARDDDL